MAQALTINGQNIPVPSRFTISHYKLSKAGRVASGKMMMDIIARKKTFSFQYEVLNGANIKVLLSLLDTNEAFVEFTYRDDDEEIKTATVYPGAISRDAFRSSPWYWKNVQFDLIEQ